MSPEEDRQDSPGLKEILRSRRLAQNRSSCLPCRERKVRCNKASPCATCVKRGHSDLCTYSVPRVNQPTRGHKDTPSSARPGRCEPAREADNGIRAAGHAAIPSVSSSSTAGSSTLFRDNSIVTVAQGTKSARQSAFETGILPLLGANDQSRAAISSVAPPGSLIGQLDEQQVSHLFETYRSRVHPFHFIIYDLDKIEKDLCSLLYGGSKADGGDSVGAHDHIHWLCLVHAIMASGAQFSDLPPSRRVKLSQTHLRLAFDALRAADYLAQPSKYALQALHLLGSVLQNDMKPQAAWVLGGTTIRLAQCLGIHKFGETPTHADISPQEASFLRRSIVWQDSLLSIAFDRPPASHDMDYEQDLAQLHSSTNNQGLSYHQAMNWMCHIGLHHISWKRSTGPLPNPLPLVRKLDLVQQALSPHLRDCSASTSLHQVQEYHALQLHLNFTISTLCRPVISDTSLPNLSPADRDCALTQLRDSLRRSVQAYIRFRLVADYARRSWACIHNGLASVLLLSVMRETRDTNETRRLQDQLIESIEQRETRLEFGMEAIDHLSDTHKNALAAIKKLRQLSENDSSQVSNDTTMNLAAQPPSTAQDTSQPSSWDFYELLQPFSDEFPSLGAFDFIMTDQGSGDGMSQLLA